MKRLIIASLSLVAVTTLAIAPANALTGRIAKARMEHLNNKALSVPPATQTHLTGRIAKARMEHLNSKVLSVPPTDQANLTGRIGRARMEQLNKK